jgi:hypothetical protein
MFPFWIVLGAVTILVGIFNRQALQRLGIRPISEVMITPNLKHSTRLIEQIGRWLLITLGTSFLVLGLGEALPTELSQTISFSLLGLSGLMLLAMVAITLANWKAR